MKSVSAKLSCPCARASLYEGV